MRCVQDAIKASLNIQAEVLIKLAAANGSAPTPLHSIEQVRPNTHLTVIGRRSRAGGGYGNHVVDKEASPHSARTAILFPGSHCLLARALGVCSAFTVRVAFFNTACFCAFLCAEQVSAFGGSGGDTSPPYHVPLCPGDKRERLQDPIPP